MDKIIIKGARENNLKNIDLELPKNKLIVMTGLSGSGKSSLAFDTIYAEGERRYVEVKSLTLIVLKDYHQVLVLIKNLLIIILEALLERLPKYMIICDYYLQE